MIYFVVVAVLVAATALMLMLLQRSDGQPDTVPTNVQNPADQKAGTSSGLVRVISPQEKLIDIGEGRPDVFEEQRIKEDLEALANSPGPFSQYVKRARIRWTKEAQIKILEHWIRFYETGAKAVQAKTTLERANSEHQQLAYENEIKLKEKDTTVARLDAEKEEHITRGVKAKQEREQVQTKEPLKSEDEIQMEATQQRDRLDGRYGLRREAGKKLNTLKELHQWYKDECKTVFSDDSLTSEEKDEQYSQLKASYEEFKRKLNADDAAIYEDDAQ